MLLKPSSFLSRAKGTKSISGNSVHKRVELIVVCKYWRKSTRSEFRMLYTHCFQIACVFAIASYCVVSMCWGQGRGTKETSWPQNWTYRRVVPSGLFSWHSQLHQSPFLMPRNREKKGLNSLFRSSSSSERAFVTVQLKNSLRSIHSLDNTLEGTFQLEVV